MITRKKTDKAGSKATKSPSGYKAAKGGKTFSKGGDRPFKKSAEGPGYARATKKRKPFEDENESSKSRPFIKKDSEREGAKVEERGSFSKSKSFKSDKPYIKKRSDSNSESFEEKAPFKKRQSSWGEKPFRSRKQAAKTPAKQTTNDGRVRLNKLIASSGICSRREADDMIIAGLVSVNGVIIAELGTKVFPEDDIRYNGERLKQERLVYILLNKPKDYITTMKDPFAKRTVLELIEGACKERVFPVGRLDRNTTGVLLLTNDGDLAKKLTHPSNNRKKVYHVHLDKNLKPSDMSTISNGFDLEDGFIKADEISYVDSTDKKQVGVEIHSGRTRIVRRIFEHFEYKVMKLDRVYFAGLSKKGLQRAQWRFLTSQEVSMLKMGSYD